MGQIIKWIKQDIVLTIALLLAIISTCIVGPAKATLTSIDFRVLGILLCLMLIMEGLKENGLFHHIGILLIHHTKSTGQLFAVLVALCFFSSMLMTNDVALITFVPFSLLTLTLCHQEQSIAFIIILQTIAANLGSMLTPVGNPQNLYLYGIMGLSLGDFMMLLLPYTIISGILLMLIICLQPKEKINLDAKALDAQKQEKPLNIKKSLIYLALFLLSLCVVLHILPLIPVLLFTMLICILLDKPCIVKVDYSLLLTFIGFFIFIGNMQRIPAINESLQQVVQHREFLTSLVASQVVSNVPATLLLSGFTSEYAQLLLGVNIGGLGTLIASMASLISYKLYTNAYPQQRGAYIRSFTFWNLCFLAVLLLGKYFLQQSV